MNNKIHIQLSSGLCNRLAALFSLMEHPNFWDFDIYWDCSAGVNCGYYELFQSPPIVSRYIQDIEESGNWKNPPLYKYCDIVSHRFWITTGAFSVAKENSDLPVLERTLFKHAKKLKAADHMIDTISKYSRIIDENTYGIHNRRGIGIQYNTRSDYSVNVDLLLNKAFCILNYNKNAKFFIASDNSSDYNKFYAALRNRMIVFPIDTYPIDSGYTKGGLHRGVIDLFLLSKCKNIICSYYSTFASVANYLSEGDRKIILNQNSENFYNKIKDETILYS